MSFEEGIPFDAFEFDRALNNSDWIPAPNPSYMLKYVFTDAGYYVMASNLTAVYSEKMSIKDMEKRFKQLNPYVSMKPQVILENVKKSLEKCLADQSDLFFQLRKNEVTITLDFHTSSMLCQYISKMQLESTNKVLQYIIAPTVFAALLGQRKILELHKKIPAENAKSSLFEPVSSENDLDPSLLKSKNLPTEIVVDSFLKIQRYSKELSAEYCETYSSAKKIKAENASEVQSVSPLKKAKLLETSNESSISFLDGDDGRSEIKKEEELNSNESIEPPKKAATKKKVLKF